MRTLRPHVAHVFRNFVTNKKRTVIRENLFLSTYSFDSNNANSVSIKKQIINLQKKSLQDLKNLLTEILGEKISTKLSTFPTEDMYIFQTMI